MIRSLEMLRHSPIMTMLFDEAGDLIQVKVYVDSMKTRHHDFELSEPRTT